MRRGGDGGRSGSHSHGRGTGVRGLRVVGRDELPSGSNVDVGKRGLVDNKGKGRQLVGGTRRHCGWAWESTEQKGVEKMKEGREL